MNANEVKIIFALSMIKGLGDTKLRNLLSQFGLPSKVVEADLELLAQAVGDKLASEIKELRDYDRASKYYEKIKNLGGEVVIWGQAGYPKSLVDIPHAPPFLTVLGALQDIDERALAIVGTRRPSHAGVKVAHDIAYELASAGITIVSGLAVGIDSVAHRAALEAGGRTIAVLGCGIDIVYPREHKDLAERIAKNGAVISEFLPGTSPEAFNFPKRNRLISGLAMGTLVVEAGARSGALITAEHARAQGKPVFAVPGTPVAETSAGTNELLKTGAKLVTSAKDIFEALGIKITKPDEVSRVMDAARGLSEDEKRVFNALTAEPVHIDVLAKKLGIPTSSLLTLLLRLELKGLVRQLPGTQFVRNL